MKLLDDRRNQQREMLIEAAERMIARDGVAKLRARVLAAEIGVALGGVYNLVGDMNELIMLVSVRTIKKMDEAIKENSKDAESAIEELSAVAVAYCRFARENLNLWRALFEYRMASHSVLPDWQARSQFLVFGRVADVLVRILPTSDRETIDLTTRTLFSAVHGVVSIGLDGKLLSVPVAAIEQQAVLLVQAICAGLPSALAERKRREIEARITR